MKIAIISDSHDRYERLWENKWKECDLCFHLGDFITKENYQSFENYFGSNRFFAVRGNMDEDSFFDQLPKYRLVNTEHFVFGLIHNKGFTPELLFQNSDFLLSGHIHHFEEKDVQLDNKTIHCVNAGTIGDDRGYGKGFVILTIEEDGFWKTEWISV